MDAGLQAGHIRIFCTKKDRHAAVRPGGDPLSREKSRRFGYRISTTLSRAGVFCKLLLCYFVQVEQGRFLRFLRQCFC